MKILLINKFLYPKGGDATSTLNTAKLLSSKGHKVILWGMRNPLNPEYPYEKYFVSNVDFDNVKGLKKIKAALNILYSFEAKDKIDKLIKLDKPDIAHLNNFAHQISPSILHVFRKYSIPVVMTMHDYKMVCASYSMLNKGQVCEACKGAKYYYCFLKKCVKNSKLKSLLNTVEMYLHHKILGIYDLVDAFISPSLFLKNKLLEMGFKKEIVHLYNFIDINKFEIVKNKKPTNENSVVYFGRLSPHKGLSTLLEAAKKIKTNVEIKIIGDGPLKNTLKEKVNLENINNVKFLDHMNGESLYKEIIKSLAVVLPSQWYENNPMSVLEAFALGKPVIGARIGGIPELVKDSETGLTFEPGNADDLSSKIDYLKIHPEKVREMGNNARIFIEQEPNADKHYEKLTDIYKTVIDRVK